ncbi:hypothetical protein N0V85_007885 [Neurospora sp. IMI 360204]|nr:hypothetical protein N0V85_007885 [Neurospora sp. IMI 360204]
MAALTPEERVIHARCRVAGIEADDDEFGMRLPPCATCTLTLARDARLLGDPTPANAQALRRQAGAHACYIDRSREDPYSACKRTAGQRICDLPVSFANWELANIDGVNTAVVATRQATLATAADELWTAYSTYHIDHADLNDNPTPRAIMRWLVGKLVDEGWRAPPDLARLTLADPLPPLDAEIEDPAEVAADDVPAPDAVPPIPEAAAAPALNELIAAGAHLGGVRGKSKLTFLANSKGTPTSS